jgi:hypothetical protein
MLGRILKAARPAPRKPAPKKPTPVKPPTNIYSKRPGMPEIGFPAIPSPGAPRMISPGPTPPSGAAPGPINELRVDPFQKRGALPPSPPPSGGATGSTGFKTAFGGIDSNMLSNRMKKGGLVKASKATKASSASKRGDGIATKGKTKGRFV